MNINTKYGIIQSYCVNNENVNNNLNKIKEHLQQIIYFTWKQTYGDLKLEDNNYMTT